MADKVLTLKLPNGVGYSDEKIAEIWKNFGDLCRIHAPRIGWVPEAEIVVDSAGTLVSGNQAYWLEGVGIEPRLQDCRMFSVSMSFEGRPSERAMSSPEHIVITRGVSVEITFPEPHLCRDGVTKIISISHSLPENVLSVVEKRPWITTEKTKEGFTRGEVLSKPPSICIVP